VQIERIDDPSDPRVVDYRNLPDADPRRRHGLFVAESRAVVRRLLAGARFRTRSILVTQPALDSFRDLLEAPPESLRVYLARPEVVRSIVGYNFHRGCLAVAERGAQPSLEEIVGPPGARFLLVLDELSDPDNVGGVFRNAMAFGVDAVLLSPGTADPLYRKAIRVSMGASLGTPFARVDDWAGGLGRLRQAGYTIVALTPRPAAVDIAELGTLRSIAERLALVLGSEAHGLRVLTLAAADLQVRIGMAPGVDSLNVATASGIALHRLRRGAIQAGPR